MNKDEKSHVPMTPAEWAKRARPEVAFSSEALTGMQEYAEYVAEYTPPKDLPDHCQDPFSGFPGGCVMEGHCKECAQTKKTHTQ